MSYLSARALRGISYLIHLPKLATSLGLRARIALLVASGLLALMAIFIVLGVSALRTSSEREVAHKSALAEMAAAHFDSVLSSTAGLGEWIATDFSASWSGWDLREAGAPGRVQVRRLASATGGALLFDRGGQLIRSEPADLAGFGSLKSEALRAMDSGARFTSDWMPRDASSVAIVTVPIQGRSGEILGYLSAMIDFAGPEFSGWLRQMALGRTSQVDLVDRKGTVLTSTAGQRRTSPDGHEGLFSSLIGKQESAVGQCHGCHATPAEPVRHRDIMAFAPLRTAEWGVVLRQSEEEVLEPTHLLQQQVLALGASSLIVALLAVWATTHGVLGPIRSLTAAARRIAGGDLAAAVDARGGDEIAELGKTLDFMRARLQRSMEQVRSYNLELNQRVTDRTVELERSRDELRKSRDEMQLLVEKLSTLNSMAVTLNGSVALDETLDAALANALRLTSMESGAIYLVNEQSGELDLAAHHGISREAAEVAGNLGLSASLCAAAAQAGEPLVVENTALYARGRRSRLLTEQMRCMVRVPFKSSGVLLGTICLGSPQARDLSRTDMDLLASAGNQIAVAVVKARLYEELQRKEKARGDLLQKVISAQEEERKRIARELHDETSQALAALAVVVETAASQAAEGADVGESLARMKALALGSLEEVHRLIFDLRPTLLDDLGLIAALRWYAESRLAEVGIKVRLEVAGEDRRLGQLIETTLYRVVQEAINNVANHSGAQSFTASLALEPSLLSLSMVDDGWGFDLEEVTRSHDSKRGLGLLGMQERVELLGGTFAVYSELGRGTRIELRVPLEGGSTGD